MGLGEAEREDVPVAVDCQCFTFLLVRRTHSIIDSHGLVEASVRLSDPVMPTLAVSDPWMAFMVVSTHTAGKLDPPRVASVMATLR